MSITIGTAHVRCPECPDLLPITVTAHLDEREDGLQYLVCDPDMTDVWAHRFVHEEDPHG